MIYAPMCPTFGELAGFNIEIFGVRVSILRCSDERRCLVAESSDHPRQSPIHSHHVLEKALQGSMAFS